MLRNRRSKRGQVEAEEARKKSEAQLRAAKAKSGPVRRIATSLRTLREENHWGEKMDEAFGGGPE